MTGRWTRPAAAAAGAALALVLAVFPLTAESRTSVKISSYAAGYSDGTGGLDLTGLATARLSIKSTGSRDVKGEFSLDSTTAALETGGLPLLDIYRAFVQTDFPALRLTLGKARLSWGDGIYFNAGDRLYGSTSLTAGLSSSVFRDEARWLAAVYLPFGMFSFVEALALPPDFVLEAAADPAYYDITHTDAGLRVVTEAVNTKFEAGYLYNYTDSDGDGSDDRGFHEPYVSLQGYLLLDWHLSAAARIDPEDPEESFRENLEITAGVAHSFYPQGAPTIGLRLEGLIRPGRDWEAVGYAGVAEAQAALADPGYGLFLYPEISLSGGAAALIVNGLYSPVDNSGMASLLGQWKIYQGLTLLGAFSFQAGQDDDLFGWDRRGGLSLTLGAEYVF